MSAEDERETIAEFQRRVRAFFVRFILSIAIMVAVLFIGGESPLGLALSVTAFGAALYFWQRYLRCPECDAILWQLPGLAFPYHACPNCRARLSRGWLCF